MRIVDRSLILLPAFAVVLLLTAVGIELTAAPRPAGDSYEATDNFDRASQLCLLGAGALVAVSIVLAAVRLVALLGRRFAPEEPTLGSTNTPSE